MSGPDTSDQPITPDRTREAAGVRWPVTVLAAAVCVALVIVGGLGYRTWQVEQTERALDPVRSEALAAARVAAADIFSYDYRRLDEDFERAARHLTGGFAESYGRTTEQVVRPTATRAKAVVGAEVQGGSVVGATRERAVVLIFFNQTTVNDLPGGAEERLPDQNRIRMTLDRVDDRWLVADIDAL